MLKMILTADKIIALKNRKNDIEIMTSNHKMKKDVFFIVKIRVKEKKLNESTF